MTTTDPRWLSSEEQQHWRAFLLVNRLLQARMDRDLEQSGMPLSYYELLVRLSEAPERTMRMRDLAACTHSLPSRVTHAVTRLEEMGWIDRQQLTTDRRGCLATLTDEGFAALAAAAPDHVESVRTHVLDPLSEDEFAQLGAIMTKLLRHFEALD